MSLFISVLYASACSGFLRRHLSVLRSRAMTDSLGAESCGMPAWRSNGVAYLTIPSTMCADGPGFELCEGLFILLRSCYIFLSLMGQCVYFPEPFNVLVKLIRQRWARGEGRPMNGRGP